MSIPFTFLVKYTSADNTSGCCVSENRLHARCLCENIVSAHQCESLCTTDDNCQGYSMVSTLTTDVIYCQPATTSSSCPSDCQGPVNTENVGKIDPQAICHSGAFLGCFIKKGKHG